MKPVCKTDRVRMQQAAGRTITVSVHEMPDGRYVASTSGRAWRGGHYAESPSPLGAAGETAVSAAPRGCSVVCDSWTVVPQDHRGPGKLFATGCYRIVPHQEAAAAEVA